MRITYIHHSGFSAELDSHVLLFDYYMGELPRFGEGKDIYVFASHKHGDHFDMDIFKLAREYENIVYILSDDIRVSESALKRCGCEPSLKKRIVTAGENMRFTVGDVEVETLKSTDEGVAFAVQCEEKSIYHAGDLNWWHWEGEPEAFNLAQERDYKRQIDSLAGRHFDDAFVPVDPRLGEKDYARGIDYFMEHTDTDRVFPMHFWRKFDTIERLCRREEAASYRDRVMKIQREGQVFEIV